MIREVSGQTCHTMFSISDLVWLQPQKNWLSGDQP